MAPLSAISSLRISIIAHGKPRHGDDLIANAGAPHDRSQLNCSLGSSLFVF
jgi:hypothetical protein